MSSATLQTLDNNKVIITFEVNSEEFEKGIQKAYIENKNKINIQGFRKGKAPRILIEQMYGKEVFFDDGLNNALPKAYGDAVDELNIEVVSKPEINVKEISKEDGAIIEATVYVKPEIEAKDYKGIEIEKIEIEVTDEEINNKILSDQEKNSRLESADDREILDKDIVNLSFEGSIDGVPFDGGKSDSHDLTIGSKTFIDNFEEQLIGLKVGEGKDVVVTFPDEYGQKDLAGKEAVFKVKINSIKQKILPDLDDDFAQDVSEFETLNEYKESIKKELQEQKDKEVKNEKINNVMEKLIEINSFEVPEAMIDSQVENLVRDYETQLKMQGIDLETYLKYMNQTEESLKDVYRPGAVNQVKGRLLLESIAKIENFEVSEEEYENEISRIAKSYNMDVENVRKTIEMTNDKGIETDLKTQKALDFIVENCIEK